MKIFCTTLVIGMAAVCGAQETPTLEELQAERDQLERQLEEKQAEIDRVQGPARTEEEREVREWQRELQEELDKVGEYLDEVPRELTMYYMSMQKALGDMLDAIDEGVDHTRVSAREKLAAAERRYWGARETAYNQDRLLELRKRAEELNATEEAAPLIQSFEQSLAAVDKAQADAAAAEAELDRTRTAAEIAGRKLEARLMEIETQRMEESLNQPRE